MKKIQLLILVWFCVSSVVAKLEWETVAQTKTVHPLQVKAEYLFPFKNSGTEAVEIEKMRPSCSCIWATVEKKTIEPGANGTLKVTFDMTGLAGHIKKSVEVTTDDTSKKRKLTVEADIPEGLYISPRRVSWQTGEKKEPKLVSLINESAKKIMIERVESSNPHVKVELIELRPGFEYQIKVTPDAEVGRFYSVTRIYTVPPEGMSESRKYIMYAMGK